MKLVEVLIEYPSNSLDRLFSYCYDGDEILEPGFRVLVPFGKGKSILSYVVKVEEITSLQDYETKTGIKLKEITKIIDKEPILTQELMDLAFEVADYYFAPRISVLLTMLPPSLKPSFSSLNKPKVAFDIFYKALDGQDLKLTIKQKELYEYIKTSGLVKKNEVSSSVASSLEKKGLLQEVKKEKNRMEEEDVEKTETKTLTEEQKEAYDTILNCANNKILLEGVTGSGKTEVYLQLAHQYLKNGENVLILVPEISLTFQMVKSFKERFDNIAILHSSLTDAQKYDEYRRIATSKTPIVVVGARSAIFAPLKSIGLIVIDEEHSETYKQETQPYYHALKVALLRLNHFPKCKLVLGSATPSLESRARAYKGVYQLVRLTKRINTTLPECLIVDMASNSEVDSQSVIYSKTLRKEIQNRLDKNEQVMLLLNRRGYAPYVSCRKCGFVFKCITCKLPLSYHQEDNTLKCHHCGYIASMIDTCPKCESSYIRKGGVGAQKAEEDLKNLFPNANILRLDSDVAKKRSATKNVLEDFKNHKADILLGTQMIAKGLDFQQVTLSGVVLADIGLNLPTFRAAEKTFSLLTQAIGRAGRNKKGQAILQTYYPNNYVLKYAQKQDYEGFYNYEMKVRKLTNYPPFCYCTVLMFVSKNEELLDKFLINIKNYLTQVFFEKEVEFIGPSEYYLKVFQGKIRKKFILKYRNYQEIVSPLKELKAMLNNQNGIEIFIDVDPYEDY